MSDEDRKHNPVKAPTPGDPLSQFTASQHRRARRAALWLLFGMDVANTWSLEAMDQSSVTALDLEPDLDALWPAVTWRIEGVINDLERLNEEIQKVSRRWKVDRMAYVDRNVLRLGVWEILQGKTPALIVINACVDLAKEFGDKSTPGFINGLLDQFCRNHDISIAP